MPRVNRLRPLALGELLDRAVTFWRANWRALFWLTVGFQLAQFTVMRLMQVAIRRWFPMFSSAEALALAQRSPEKLLPQVAGLVTLLLVSTFLVLFVSQVGGVATSHFGWRRLLGSGAPTPADSFRHAAQRLVPTFGAFALSIGWSFIVMVGLLLPAVGLGGLAAWFTSSDSGRLGALFALLAAIALVVALVVLVLWFIIRFVLLGQILAIEDVGAWRAFRRADELSSGRVLAGAMGLVKLRLTVLITVMGGVLLIIGTVASAPTLIAGALYGAGFTAGTSLYDVVPTAVLVPLELLDVVLTSVVAPLYVMFQLFFYGDMRMRREGLDLELALGAQPA